MRLFTRPTRPRRSLVLLGIPLLAAAIAVPTLALSANGSPSLVHSKTFSLKPSGALNNLSCLQPNGKTATAKATVTRGAVNDTLKLTLAGFKPNLGFDLFTVQLNAPPFGMAWYQSDVETNSTGGATVTIKTILLDQIFGFSGGGTQTFAPVNTFHVGFWFDSPQEAQGCLNTPAPTTPFNGEHNAGPLAFITQANATTGLGPLCTQPVTSPPPTHCNP
jgi:hypothetical protein